MTDGDLVPTLADRGFETVDAGLPGGWATDGTYTVCVETRQRGGGMGARSTLEHEVLVFEAPPDEVDLDSTPAARTVDTSHGAAVRRALEEAGDDNGEGVTCDDCGRSVPSERIKDLVNVVDSDDDPQVCEDCWQAGAMW